jgi:hypothetical protein
MQTANVLVNIGGDSGNQVPKEVTAAEIAVLLAIHGDEAVQDISPLGDVDRTNRDELARLRGTYGRATDGDGNRIIDRLFPGAGARVFETLDELGLPEKMYKALTRATAPAPVAAVEAVADEPAASRPRRAARRRPKPLPRPNPRRSSPSRSWTPRPTASRKWPTWPATSCSPKGDTELSTPDLASRTHRRGHRRRGLISTRC